MVERIRIGALVSGGGTNLQAIIDACERGSVSGRMVFVGSDNPEAKGLERAKSRGIPTFAVDYRSIIRGYRAAPEEAALPDDLDIEDILLKQSLLPEDEGREKRVAFIASRAIAEARLVREIMRYPFDLIVLAGFMRNLTPYFIDKINAVTDRHRIMNIHPALLPAFPGVDGYGDTFRYGCKVGGCTVHFIDYGEDSGPIVGQRAFDIQEDDTLASIKEKGLALEWQLYPECIQLFAEGRLQVVRPTEGRGDGIAVQRPVVRFLPPG